MDKPSRTVWKVKDRKGSFLERAAAVAFAHSEGLQEESVFAKQTDWVTPDDDRDLADDIVTHLEKVHENAGGQ